MLSLTLAGCRPEELHGSSIAVSAQDMGGKWVGGSSVLVCPYTQPNRGSSPLTSPLLRQSTCWGVVDGLSSPPQAAEELESCGKLEQVSSAGGKPLTIEQMLSEIEREYNGPDYRYVAQRGESPTPNHASSPVPSPASSSLKVVPPPPAPPTGHPAPPTGQGFQPESYDFLLPSTATSHSVVSCPAKPFDDHTYEQLPQQGGGGGGGVESDADTDTYVYMAPHRADRVDIVRSSSLPPTASGDR